MGPDLIYVRRTSRNKPDTKTMSSYPESPEKALAEAGEASKGRKEAVEALTELNKEGGLKQLHALSTKNNATKEDWERLRSLFSKLSVVSRLRDDVLEDIANETSPYKIGTLVRHRAPTDNEKTIAEVQAVVLCVTPLPREDEWMYHVRYTIPNGVNKGRVVSKNIYGREIIGVVE